MFETALSKVFVSTYFNVLCQKVSCIKRKKVIKLERSTLYTFRKILKFLKLLLFGAVKR